MALHNALGNFKAAVKICRRDQCLDNVRRDTGAVTAAGLLLAVAEKQIIAQRELFCNKCKVLFTYKLSADTGKFALELVREGFEQVFRRNKA